MKYFYDLLCPELYIMSCYVSIGPVYDYSYATCNTMNYSYVTCYATNSFGPIVHLVP